MTFVSLRETAKKLGTNTVGCVKFLKARKIEFFKIDSTVFTTQETANFLLDNYKAMLRESQRTSSKKYFEKKVAEKAAEKESFPKQLAQELVNLQGSIRELSFFIEMLAEVVTKNKAETNV
jgi:hypothetical protein